jgi:hypothetical protein
MDSVWVFMDVYRDESCPVSFVRFLTSIGVHLHDILKEGIA